MLHQGLEDEVGGRRKYRTCDCQMPSAESKNAQVFPTETCVQALQVPSPASTPFIHSSLTGEPMWTSLGSALVARDLTGPLLPGMPVLLGEDRR